MIIEESEYKGKPVLTIKTDEEDRYPFTFGLSKAQKIIDAYQDILSFVNKHKVNE